MIVFNKSNYYKEYNPTIKKVITKESVKQRRRVRVYKKIHQSNKQFLKALGFKV